MIRLPLTWHDGGPRSEGRVRIPPARFVSHHHRSNRTVSNRERKVAVFHQIQLYPSDARHRSTASPTTRAFPTVSFVENVCRPSVVPAQLRTTHRSSSCLRELSIAKKILSSILRCFLLLVVVVPPLISLEFASPPPPSHSCRNPLNSPRPSTLDPGPSTLDDPRPSILDPRPSILDPLIISYLNFSGSCCALLLRATQFRRHHSVTMGLTFTLLLCLLSSQALAFRSHRNALYATRYPRHALPRLYASDDGGYPAATDTDDKYELDDLQPPSVSFTRNSVLFGENPPTQRNNGPLWLWRGAKSILPSFATGAWDEGKGDATPVEHLYNLLFVRMPTVLMGILYMRNLSMGHPLVMNYGDGFFEVPPLGVRCVFLVLLR